MRTREALHHLQLDQHAALDHEIGAEALGELDAFVREADRLLPHDAQPASLEDGRERDFVGRLEEAGPEIAMHLHRRIDDDTGDVVDLHRQSSALSILFRASASFSFQGVAPTCQASDAK